MPGPVVRTVPSAYRAAAGSGCTSPPSTRTSPKAASTSSASQTTQPSTHQGDIVSDVTGEILQAAAATDRTMTDFVLESAVVEAERVLADRRWFLISDEQWDEFQRLLEQPARDQRGLNWEPSRLSHHLTRMQRRSLVRREGCADDGWRVIEAAAPGHVDAVRRLFLDCLTPEQITLLGQLSTQVLARLDARDCPTHAIPHSNGAATNSNKYGGMT